MTEAQESRNRDMQTDREDWIRNRGTETGTQGRGRKQMDRNREENKRHMDRRNGQRERAGQGQRERQVQ